MLSENKTYIKLLFSVCIMSLYKPLQKKDLKEDGGNQIKLD